MHRQWKDFLGSSVEPHCLDAETVKSFHVLMPAHSSKDSQEICASMRNLQAFPRVRSPTIRREIEARLLRCERILTFKSYHHDMILLEGCYQPLRDLFPTIGTTLQSSCEASFRHDLRYFRANYIELWLRVMRKYPYLSDHASASVKKEIGGDKFVPCLKSETEVSQLVSFAKSRGFWTYDIANPLLYGTDEIQLESATTFFPKLSCKKGNIRRNNRCSRPRARDFEQAWKHLSLQSVFQDKKQATLKYPTAFAVARNIAHCFWGAVAPGEIDNPGRILEAHQLTELQNDSGSIRDELQGSLSQIVTVVHTDPMQGVSQHQAKMRRPTSSIYSRSGRSPSTLTSPQFESVIDGKEWRVETFIESYRDREDVPSTGNGAEGHEIESHVDPQANESNGDALMLLSSDSSPTSTEEETSNFASQARKGHLRGERLEVDKGRDRVERADERLHEVKKEGHRRNPHRIEKPQHYNEKKKLKQQQAHLTRVLQNHNNDPKLTASQREYVNLLDTERTEVDNVSNPPSAGDVSVVSNSELAMPQLVHDDRDIKVHLHDSEQDIQGSANQWCTQNENDDVQTATRKAEEQMYGAEDAVNEVYDEEPDGQTQQFERDEIDYGESSHDTINIPKDTTSDLFPGGSINRATNSSLGRHGLTQKIAPPTLSEVQAETIEGSTPRQDKRKAIYCETGSVNEADHSAIPQIQISASQTEESDTAVVGEGAAIPTDRPESMFPGGPLVQDRMKQRTTEEHSSAQTSTLSKKRYLPSESEDADVDLRPPKTSNQAQLNSWEPFQETVDAIGRILNNLDHARIYATSSIAIVELSAQQHLNHVRLWSWLKDDQELFDRQMSSLLMKGFGFQVVCSDAHLQGRRYCSLEHMEYWNAYFGDNECGYWLAVITPWRSRGSSREKVRKTHGDKNCEPNNE